MPRERSEVALGTNGKGVTGFVPVLVAHRPRRPLPVCSDLLILYESIDGHL